MNWLKRFFGQSEVEESEPVETPEPGEYKAHINTTAQGGDMFSVCAIVYRWDTNWFTEKTSYGWRLDKRWDWSCHLKTLDYTEARALEYAQQYIDNTKRNDHKVIHIKE